MRCNLLKKDNFRITNLTNQSTIMQEENFIIDLDTAIKWAKKWREVEGDYNKHNEVHAFLIPKESLLGVLSQGVDSVRAYIGVDDDNVEKLMFVGTRYDQESDTYVDMLPGGAIEGSIYDFTRPCPPACDKKSILNNLGS